MYTKVDKLFEEIENVFYSDKKYQELVLRDLLLFFSSTSEDMFPITRLGFDGTWQDTVKDLIWDARMKESRERAAIWPAVSDENICATGREERDNNTTIIPFK